MFHIRATGQWPPGQGPRQQVGGRNYPMLPTPIGPLHSGMACLWGPPSGSLAPDILFPRSLDLAAIDMKLVAVNLNSGFGHLMWVQRALARNKPNHLVWVSHVLFTLFGTPFICHQWGSLSDVEMPPTWEKGSNLPPGTTKLGNLRDGCDPSQLPLPNLIFRILPPLCWAHPGMPEMWQGAQGC